MKCPNCGLANGKTNKYCRECGTRLDVLTSAHETADSHTDEVALGEELFKVIELFESGDLDAALETGAKLAEQHKGSASAHSIVALVYERKAEYELAEGNSDSSHDFLKLAIDHYERLIDLNPDSAADREKLASLRLKYTGHAAPPIEDEPFSFRRVMRAVPTPAWVVFGVFVVVLFLVVLLTAPPQAKPHPTAMITPAETPAVAVTPTEPQNPGLKVYTFNAEPNPAPPAPSRMPVPSVNVPNSQRIDIPEVRPAHVPKIDQNIDLIAEPKATTPKKPAADSAKPAVKPAEKPASDRAPTGQGGASMLAQAIRLHDEGKISEAVGAANQAIALYQADLDAGRDTEAASRGIKNANRLISVWQESAGDTGM